MKKWVLVNFGLLIIQEEDVFVLFCIQKNNYFYLSAMLYVQYNLSVKEAYAHGKKLK